MAEGAINMILQITNPNQLQKAIGQEFKDCLKHYCEKAKDGVTEQDLLEILQTRVFTPKPTADFFLALDDKYRVRGFAIVRMVFDPGLGWALDFWHVYVSPKAPEVLESGLEDIKEIYLKRGVRRFQFCSARGVDGGVWDRVLKGFGFREKAIIYELEVIDDGQSENRPGIDGHNPTVATNGD